MVGKDEVMAEFGEFLQDYLESLNRVYHPVLSLGRDAVDVTETNFWRVMSDMYDYGVNGIPVEGRDLGAKKLLDAEFIDVDLFLNTVPALQPFLDEDDIHMPLNSIRTARLAVARHVLDGGDRDTIWDDGQHPGYLTIAEIALLADMDERSVRNAATTTQKNRLVTETISKRTVVSVSNARLWLASRKGFTPTQIGADGQPADSLPEIPAQLLRELNTRAAASGLTAVEFIRKQILSA